MVSKVDYPDKTNADLNEWGVMIQDLEVFTRGLLLIAVENINTSSAPRILGGSMLDINGSKYKCTQAEDMANDSTNNAQNYIYAVAAPNGETASFMYSTVEPQWDSAKGGWYNGNNRAIVKLYVTDSRSRFNNKVVLDSYNAMYMLNNKQTITSTTGVSQFNRTSVGEWEHDLAPGIYRYELKAGDGGPGGPPGDFVSSSGLDSFTVASGENGGIGATKTGIYYHPGGRIQVKVGANGGAGGKGGDGASDYLSTPSLFYASPGCGGGGGGGIDSFIGGIIAKGGLPGLGGSTIIKDKGSTYSEVTIAAPPGSPGGYGVGGNGSDNGGVYLGTSYDSVNNKNGSMDIRLFKPGRPGGTPSGTSGYARLYRIG